jgi:hypothetical protein
LNCALRRERLCEWGFQGVVSRPLVVLFMGAFLSDSKCVGDKCAMRARMLANTRCALAPPHGRSYTHMRSVCSQMAHVHVCTYM